MNEGGKWVDITHPLHGWGYNVYDEPYPEANVIHRDEVSFKTY